MGASEQAALNRPKPSLEYDHSHILYSLFLGHALRTQKGHAAYLSTARLAGALALAAPSHAANRTDFLLIFDGQRLACIVYAAIAPHEHAAYRDLAFE